MDGQGLERFLCKEVEQTGIGVTVGQATDPCLLSCSKMETCASSQAILAENPQESFGHKPWGNLKLPGEASHKGPPPTSPFLSSFWKVLSPPGQVLWATKRSASPTGFLCQWPD